MEFSTEKGTTYKYQVKKDLMANKIKLSRQTECLVRHYEEFFEVGATVEMFWSKDQLSDTEWIEGKRQPNVIIAMQHTHMRTNDIIKGVSFYYRLVHRRSSVCEL